MSPPRKKLKKLNEDDEVGTDQNEEERQRKEAAVSSPSGSLHSTVIRFDIANVSKLRDSQYVPSSQPIDMGGITWRAEARRRCHEGESRLVLNLDGRLNPSYWAWSIDVNVEFTVVNNADSNKNFTEKIYDVLLDKTSFRARQVHMMRWSDLIDSEKGFVHNDRVAIECRVSFHNMVVFLIEERRILAARDFLSLHSFFFNALFHSGFNDKNKEEIELKDVTHENFRELITTLHECDVLGMFDREAANSIPSLLELGDRYGIKAIVDYVETYLQVDDMHNQYYNKEERMRLADQYRLIKLNATCQSYDEQNTEETHIRMKLCECLSGTRMNSHNSGSFPTVLLLNSFHDGVISHEYSCFQSTVYEVSGLQWSLDGKCTENKGNFHLSLCLIGNRNKVCPYNWSATGIVEIEIAHPNPQKRANPIIKQYEFSLDNSTRKAWTDEYIVDGNDGYLGDSTFVRIPVTTRLFLKKLSGVIDVPSFDFAAPSPLGDATLLVGDKRIHVNKQYLSSISTTFREMFASDLSGRDEVKLEGIEYQTSLDIMKWVFPRRVETYEEDRIELFRKKAVAFKLPFIRENIEKWLNSSPAHAHLAEKLADCTKIEFDIEHPLFEFSSQVRESMKRDFVNIIKSVCLYMGEEEDNLPKWLLPFLKKSRCYQELGSENKVRLLEWMHLYPDLGTE